MTAATHLLDLSQELLDYIIDLQLSDSSYPSLLDLRNCSLVCRRLRWRAQRNIYRTINLTTQHRVNNLIGLISSNPRLAAYISTITTTSQQFAPLNGLDIPLSFLLLRIKELSPHSTVSLEIHPHATNLVEHHTTATRFVAPTTQANYLPSVVSLELLGVDNFPADLLFYFTNLKYLGIHNTVFHPALDTFASARLVQLATSLCRSITTLLIHSHSQEEYKFPGILIASCQSLEHLAIEAVTLTNDVVLPATPRPKITYLAIAHYKYDTVKTLADSLVDLSELLVINDTTEPQDHDYDAFTDEKYDNTLTCLKYLLHASKSSLLNLHLSYCVFATSTETKPLIFDLSQIPNLTTLVIFIHCHALEEDHISAARFLRDTLLTLSPKTSRLTHLSLHFSLMLEGEAVGTDRDQVVHLDLRTLPAVLAQRAEWAEIRRLFADFAQSALAREPISVELHVRNRDSAHVRYQHNISPDTEGAVFQGTICRWMREEFILVPSKGNVEFFYSTYPAPLKL